MNTADQACCHALGGQLDSLLLSAVRGSYGQGWDVGVGWTETQANTVWYSPSVLSGGSAAFEGYVKSRNY